MNKCPIDDHHKCEWCTRHGKKFLNVGGKASPHLGVGSLCDILMYSGNAYKATSMTIDYDLLSLSKIPRQDEYYDLIYSSATFEHLLDEPLLHVLSECYRMLKKEGVLRITCPDSMHILDRFLMEEEIPWKPNDDSHFTNFDAFFFNTFQILSEKEKSISCQKVDEKEFRSMIKEHGKKETFIRLSHLTEKIINQLKIKHYSSYHVNPLCPEKTQRLLESCGFSDIQSVKRHEGYSVMKRSPLNHKLPWASFYITCRKT